jgi:hypothetical protein
MLCISKHSFQRYLDRSKEGRVERRDDPPRVLQTDLMFGLLHHKLECARDNRRKDIPVAPALSSESPGRTAASYECSLRIERRPVGGLGPYDRRQSGNQQNKIRCPDPGHCFPRDIAVQPHLSPTVCGENPIAHAPASPHFCCGSLP